MPRITNANLTRSEGFQCPRCKNPNKFTSPRLLSNHLFADHLVDSKSAWEESTEAYNAYVRQSSTQPKKISEIIIPKVEVRPEFKDLPGAYVVPKPEKHSSERVDSVSVSNNLPSPKQVAEEVEKMTQRGILANPIPKSGFRKPDEPAVNVLDPVSVHSAIQHQAKVIRLPVRKKRKKIPKKETTEALIRRYDQLIERFEFRVRYYTLIRDQLRVIQEFVP